MSYRRYPLLSLLSEEKKKHFRKFLWFSVHTSSFVILVNLLSLAERVTVIYWVNRWCRRLCTNLHIPQYSRS
jgi:hypothetical protein